MSHLAGINGRVVVPPATPPRVAQDAANATWHETGRGGVEMVHGAEFVFAVTAGAAGELTCVEYAERRMVTATGVLIRPHTDIAMLRYGLDPAAARAAISNTDAATTAVDVEVGTITIRPAQIPGGFATAEFVPAATAIPTQIPWILTGAAETRVNELHLDPETVFDILDNPEQSWDDDASWLAVRDRVEVRTVGVAVIGIARRDLAEGWRLSSRARIEAINDDISPEELDTAIRHGRRTLTDRGGYQILWRDIRAIVVAERRLVVTVTRQRTIAPTIAITVAAAEQLDRGIVQIPEIATAIANEPPGPTGQLHEWTIRDGVTARGFSADGWTTILGLRCR